MKCQLHVDDCSRFNRMSLRYKHWFQNQLCVFQIQIQIETLQVDDWSRVNRMGLWYKPWFYHHVKTFLQTGEQVFVADIVNIVILTIPTIRLSIYQHWSSTRGTTNLASG